ncbi:MAG: thermonuclease family protein [Fusobacteriaceae bacterium]
MKRITLLFFIVCNFIFTFTGKVTKVADGDTITVLTNGKSVRVRFYGIDAPEKKIGLWQNSNPMAPWEFRRKNK